MEQPLTKWISYGMLAVMVYQIQYNARAILNMGGEYENMNNFL